MLQFSATSKLQIPDTSNVSVLLQCVGLAGENRTGLTGDGAYTWGDYNEIQGTKSLVGLFWGLFTGMFISPGIKLKRNAFLFTEHLVTVRPPESGHTLMNWAMLHFVPFYDRLQEEHPFPFPNMKFLMPLWPVWVILIIYWLILQSLWKFLSMLWWMIAPLKPLNRNDAEDLEKGTLYDPTN